MPPKNPKVDLRLKYRKVFEVSIILSLLLVLTAFTFFPRIEREQILAEIPNEFIRVDDIIPTDSKPEPPPPPKPIVEFVEDLIDDDMEDIPIKDTDWDNYEPTENLSPIEDEENNEIFDFLPIENMPKIIGGLAALQKNVVYPEIAVRAAVQGKVVMKVLIGKKGEVEDIEILKSIGAGCDEAAIAAVMNTKFDPGRQRGKPVRVYVSIPIMFKLN